MAHAYSTSLSQNRNFPRQQRGSRSTGLTPYTGPWGTAQAVHLLKRTMFGAAKTDVDYFAGLSADAAVNELLTTAATPTPPLNNYNDANYTDPNVPAGQTWVSAPYDNLVNAKRRYSFKSWWVGQMLNQGRSLQEKMTLFWHNHFATEATSVGDARIAYKNNALLRAYALGNFKDLVKQVTLDPAMLRYLNGYLNTKNAPDENYARELQELFTVGKDPNQPYSEDDVKEAARVLTGYRIDTNTLTGYFDPNKHDTGNKQFSAFYSNTQITGQSGAAGANELDALLDMIFATDNVSVYLCKKLYRYFVYYNIDSDAETNVIQPLAAILRSNNYEIKPVLAALFKSEHFFDELNRGCVIKTPADYFIGGCREFNTVFPAGNLTLQYYVWKAMHTQLALCSMELAEPPNVAGWPAWYQAPAYHELWINSDTLPKRTLFADTMISTGITLSGFTLNFDVLAFAAGLPNPTDPNQLINDTLGLLYSIDTGTDLFNYLKSILLSGQATDSYWSSAWIDYLSDTANATYRGIVESRLKQMFQYLVDLAEYQLS